MNEAKGTLLVTGATGFLGSEVVRLASSSGWQVRALVRGEAHAFGEDVEIVRGTVDDTASLTRACVLHAAGLAHVFGPAAKDFARFLAVNAAGTENVVRAAVALQVPRVAVVSSVAVYGQHGGQVPDETFPCRPEGAYAESKFLGEQRALERAAGSEVRLSILRMPTLYGEGDRGNVARLIAALEKGRFAWAGDGSNRKSLIYKEDAARACLTAAEQGPMGMAIFNVPAHTPTMREIVNTICSELGKRPPHLSIPAGALRIAVKAARFLGDRGKLEERLEKFLRDDVYDSSGFQGAFGHPALRPLEEGFRREIASMRSRA